MKLNRLFLLLFLLTLAAPARAIVLRGVVSDVPDGQRVVVSSGGRQLVVVLKGVAAPEMNSEFGEVARRHLSSLLLNKGVEVDFNEFQSGQVFARVYCGEMDVALQVIRDGAAWYDKISAVGLTDLERRLYSEAEQTAHNEMRGVWHDGSPMPPWEWRRLQAAKAERERVHIPTQHTSGRGLQTEDILARSGKDGGKFNAALRNRSRAAATVKPTAKPTAKPLNRPGLDTDLSPYLSQGRTSIVYFYADWCPACRQMTPLMDAINSGNPDTQVLFMNIADWGTPVAQRYSITSIPYFRIFDKNGNLVAEGKDARSWLSQNVTMGR